MCQLNPLHYKNRDAFLKECKKVWRASTLGLELRGRPSVREDLIQFFCRAYLEGLIGDAASTGQLLEAFREHGDFQHLSDRVICKYARIWLLTFQKKLEDRTQKEIQWLEKFDFNVVVVEWPPTEELLRECGL